MGKDLNGNKLGKGISQRKDGRYYARIVYMGEKIERYNSNLKELKRMIAEDKAAIDNNINKEKYYTVTE